MIFTEKRWGDDGYLVVCGSMWPGFNEGAPMPEGYPNHWRSGRSDVSAAVGTAGGGQPNASDLGSVETQKGNTE